MAASRTDGEGLKGFLIGGEYADSLEDLNLEQKGWFLDAMLRDLRDEAPDPAMDPMARILFKAIVPSVRRMQGKTARSAETARENGRSGGRPKKSGAEDENPPVSEETRRFSEKPVGFPENPAVFEETQNDTKLNLTELNSTEKNSLPPSPPPGGGSETSGAFPKKRFNLRWEDFAEWYKAYPRKEKPADAKRAWEKAVKSGLLAPLPVLLETLGWQREKEQWQNPKFVPLPATYLNSQSWLDQRPKQAPSARDRPRQRWGPSPEEGSFSLSAGIREAVDKLKAEAAEAGEAGEEA